MTTLLILCAKHASNTLIVPFTAGLINSSSFFGYLKGTGDAVWTTKSAPSIAKNNESLFPKSASTNSSWLKSLPNAYRKGSIF